MVITVGRAIAVAGFSYFKQTVSADGRTVVVRNGIATVCTTPVVMCTTCDG